MKLTLTLGKNVTTKAAERIVRQAKKAGAHGVQPLFADTPLPELKRFYILDVPDDLAKNVMDELRDADGVDEIERSARRRPT